MDEDLRYAVSGAAIGAMVGALTGWLLFKSRQSGGQQTEARAVSPRSAFNLGMAVLAIVRQIADL